MDIHGHNFLLLKYMVSLTIALRLVKGCRTETRPKGMVAKASYEGARDTPENRRSSQVVPPVQA